MGRFGGYSTGYNPLLRSQMAVANTLRGGLSDLGQRPLDEAKFGLLEAKTLSDLSRQKKSDTRQQEQFDVEQPVRQMQLDKLKEQQAFENEPVRIGELFKLMYGKKEPDPETVMHMVSNDWQGDLMQATGGTIKDGVLYRKTGEPVTRKQLPQIVPFLGQIVGSNVNYGHLLNQKMSALEGRKNLAPEEKIKLEKLKAYKKDPNWLIDKYEMQNQKDAQVMAWLQGQGRKEFPYLKRNMETRTAKIARLREKAKAAEKRSAEQDARRFDRETQLMVKRLGNQAAGLKGAKPSTFQKEAEFYAEVTGITKSEAADILRADDTLGERLRLAAEEIKIVATRVENMDITASQATKEIETIKKTYGLSGERTLRGLPKDKGDPDDIRSLLLKPDDTAEKTGNNKDTRSDGTLKGPGFMGTLNRPDGNISTELSIGVNIDGKEIEIPSLVPTLTAQEVDHLLAGKPLTDEIVKKATAHAKKRIAAGLSPFKTR